MFKNFFAVACMIVCLFDVSISMEVDQEEVDQEFVMVNPPDLEKTSFVSSQAMNGSGSSGECCDSELSDCGSNDASFDEQAFLQKKAMCYLKFFVERLNEIVLKKKRSDPSLSYSRFFN